MSGVEERERKEFVLSVLHSPRIVEILEILEKRSLSKKELREKLGVSGSSLVQTVAKMNAMGLVEDDGESVSITPKGVVILKAKGVLEDYNAFLNSVEKYINEYLLDDIPKSLLKRLYELGELTIIDRAEDTFKPHDEFVEELSKAKKIEGYSTIFFADYVDVFSRFADEGKEIKVAVNEKVLSQMVRNYKQELLMGLSYPNVELYISRKDFRFCVVLTEYYFSISFYLRNGLFDYRRDFATKSEGGRRWGRAILDHIMKHCVRVDADFVERFERAGYSLKGLFD